VPLLPHQPLLLLPRLLLLLLLPPEPPAAAAAAAAAAVHARAAQRVGAAPVCSAPGRHGLQALPLVRQVTPDAQLLHAAVVLPPGPPLVGAQPVLLLLLLLLLLVRRVLPLPLLGLLQGHQLRRLAAAAAARCQLSKRPLRLA
jgi:hypothetical protein